MAAAAREDARPRSRIALLSNPRSPNSIAQLPHIRAFCAEHPDLFHYEVEHSGQVSEAMKSIARVRPALLAINGGEGIVRAALGELGQFGDVPPRVEVMAEGSVANLRRLIDAARSSGLAA